MLKQHAGIKTADIGLLQFLVKEYQIKTLLDIGCGLGGNVQFARLSGLSSFGIDIDNENLPTDEYFHTVDYREGSSNLIGPFDIGLSVEFVEHVEEEYIDNFMQDFKKCSNVILTGAPPGWGGVGHVNEQTEEYWIKMFESNGFVYDGEKTKSVRAASHLFFYDDANVKAQLKQNKKHIRFNSRPEKKQWVRNRGLFFVRVNF